MGGMEDTGRAGPTLPRAQRAASSSPLRGGHGGGSEESRGHGQQLTGDDINLCYRASANTAASSRGPGRFGPGGDDQHELCQSPLPAQPLGRVPPCRRHIKYLK
jgi:hypothetical protein